MSRVNLLWTSGWDSTFRLLQVLAEGSALVQPWYVVHPKRRSLDFERRAAANIRAAIKEYSPAWDTRMLPTRDIAISGLDYQESLVAITNVRASWGHLGKQYAWLAAAVESSGVTDMELSIHRDDRAYDFIRIHTVPIAPGSSVRRLGRAAAEKSAMAMFAPFRFPILDWTKLDMERWAAVAGLLHILDLTWFCHKPIGGKPCARCNPCRYTVAEGLARRVPLARRVRTWFADRKRRPV